jgi:hypothetical protein
MIRLIHKWQCELGEIHEVDVEPAGLYRFRSHPFRDGEAYPAGTNTTDDDH